jgi:hypothetical protein
VELRYLRFDRELLASYSAVQHFRFLVEGRRFTLLRIISHWCWLRHKSLLPHPTDLRYIEGKQNLVAHAFSRPSVVLPRVVVTPGTPSLQISVPSATLTVPNAALPLVRCPWLQVVAEMYQRPETHSYCPLGSPGGSLEVSGSPAPGKLSTATSAPNLHPSGSTQFFKTGPDPCVGARSVSEETLVSQAPLPAAKAAPLLVSTLPVVVRRLILFRWLPCRSCVRLSLKYATFRFCFWLRGRCKGSRFVGTFPQGCSDP